MPSYMYVDLFLCYTLKHAFAARNALNFEIANSKKTFYILNFGISIFFNFN